MPDLDRYHEKRDFEKTPEPEGPITNDVVPEDVVEASCRLRGEDGSCEPGLAYVIHKHAARRLHYDLRLEMDGALVSWAVPKGPSYDSHDKRLAVHVEDHPIEYGSFEGTIPAGEYGGGTVMVWDRGTWEPIGDPAESMAAGQLKFNLYGEKLVGRWVLVRMKPRKGEKSENWLLIKERDEHVRPATEYDVLTARPESVASGRDMQQIADGGDDQDPLQSAASSGTAGLAQGAPSGRAAAEDSDRSESRVSPSGGTHEGPMPADAPLQLATLVGAPPEGAEWIREIKYDGYRLRIAKNGDEVRLLTRGAKDWTERFPELVDAARRLPAESALIDGEVVVFGKGGVPDFGSLQHALSRKDTRHVVLMAFDLLYLNGWDLLGMGLLERKELLRTMLAAAGDGPFRYAEHVADQGALFHKEACTLALEGSVSKLASAPYRPGRTRDWRKVKCLKRQEFVIGGYTEARGTRSGFGALLLGVREADGELRFAGRVGTGFTDLDLDMISPRLADIAREDSPFTDDVKIKDRNVYWVDPALVAEVSFQEWTEAGIIRHSAFLGMREDIDSTDVIRERAVTLPSYSAAQDDPEPSGTDEETSSGGTRPTKSGLTNPDKVLFPQINLTKAELAAYYESIAEAILPHIARRPLTLVRCPHGREGECFYQKHPDKRGWPDAIHTFEVAEKDGPALYGFVEDIHGLLALVQLGALELHTWNSLVDHPELPDRVVFDLDPGPGVDWPTVVSSAELVRDVLHALGFGAFVKTTGGKGLHVVTPIVARHDYARVRAFARGLVDRLASHDPQAFTAKMAKSARSGRVFIDYLRNAHGATAVVAYSTRARAGAPVSVPLAWDELEHVDDPGDFDVRTVPDRVRDLAENPWEGYEEARTEITHAHMAALGLPDTE